MNCEKCGSDSVYAIVGDNTYQCFDCCRNDEIANKNYKKAWDIIKNKTPKKYDESFLITAVGSNDLEASAIDLYMKWTRMFANQLGGFIEIRNGIDNILTLLNATVEADNQHRLDKLKEQQFSDMELKLKFDARRKVVETDEGWFGYEFPWDTIKRVEKETESLKEDNERLEYACKTIGCENQKLQEEILVLKKEVEVYKENLTSLFIENKELIGKYTRELSKNALTPTGGERLEFLEKENEELRSQLKSALEKNKELQKETVTIGNVTFELDRSRDNFWARDFSSMLELSHKENEKLKAEIEDYRKHKESIHHLQTQLKQEKSHLENMTKARDQFRDKLDVIKRGHFNTGVTIICENGDITDPNGFLLYLTSIKCDDGVRIHIMQDKLYANKVEKPWCEHIKVINVSPIIHMGAMSSPDFNFEEGERLKVFAFNNGCQKCKESLRIK